MRLTASRSSSTSSSASGASADRSRRRWLVAAALVSAVVVVLGLVLLVNGRRETDPLARIVPADALGWMRVDPHAPPGALALAAKFPALRALPDRLAGTFGPTPPQPAPAPAAGPGIAGAPGPAWLSRARP